MRRLLFVILAIVFLGVLYYGISPLFRNTKVDEALPAGSPTAAPVQEMMPSQAVAPREGVGGEVVGTTGHPASGTARIVTADGKSYVRYENFKTINGPDIYVYLSKDIGAKDYINLGRVKATEGNINYEIPAGTDVAAYPYVLTWCKTFGVLFNSAKIQ